MAPSRVEDRHRRQPSLSAYLRCILEALREVRGADTKGSGTFLNASLRTLPTSQAEKFVADPVLSARISLFFSSQCICRAHSPDPRSTPSTILAPPPASPPFLPFPHTFSARILNTHPALRILLVDPTPPHPSSSSCPHHLTSQLQPYPPHLLLDNRSRVPLHISCVSPFCDGAALQESSRFN